MDIINQKKLKRVMSYHMIMVMILIKMIIKITFVNVVKKKCIGYIISSDEWDNFKKFKKNLKKEKVIYKKYFR